MTEITQTDLGVSKDVSNQKVASHFWATLVARATATIADARCDV